MKGCEKVKKYITVIISVTFAIMSMLGNIALTSEFSLIKNMKIELKSAETPNRLEVCFDLTEPIDLSQGESNIIFEYFITNSDGNLEAINYKKDKSWAGYLNSYDNYPYGERKYSLGEENENYPDRVPSSTIYTSVKTGGSIDTTQVAAVKVTVLKADGSGEEYTAYSSVSNVEKNTGIRLQSTALELPVNTEALTLLIAV